jgi:hypothetical protein
MISSLGGGEQTRLRASRSSNAMNAPHLKNGFHPFDVVPSSIEGGN